MINLFITYLCNFDCDYCFVRGLGNRYPERISQEDFDRLCIWLAEKKVVSLGILGGEPTVHPHLAEMLEKLNHIGVAPVLFTNGLFRSALRKPLSAAVANFVVNCNDPSMYTQAQWDRLQDNLSALKDAGCSLSFSKNFSPGKLRCDYLLEACARYGVTSVRYDIARPNPSEENHCFDLDGTRALAGSIMRFVQDCESRGIATGLDCCIPLCYFDSGALESIRRVSVKFSGICHPSLDIHSDLSATYCIPMQDVCVPDVTVFDGEQALLRYFSDAVRPLRFGEPRGECTRCNLFGRQCQGGCLALKQKEI